MFVLYFSPTQNKSGFILSCLVLSLWPLFSGTDYQLISSRSDSLLTSATRNHVYLIYTRKSIFRTSIHLFDKRVKLLNQSDRAWLMCFGCNLLYWYQTTSCVDVVPVVHIVHTTVGAAGMLFGHWFPPHIRCPAGFVLALWMLGTAIGPDMKLW